ncbi:MAG: UDP-N-acetylmuramoyl-tripeptide--D-alanyl-D-alanine ligase [Lachnospiraceae bacterium]|nr:UDP-N-acetylmuramoyl-tripeptide--D-alanyl-D-alanine ligase [Lachnospiraceae bacterium]
MKLSLKEIAKITDGVLISGNPEDEVYDLCIDSRVAKKGDLFVPLLGANTDGHHYLQSALKEAAASLCSKEGISVPKDKGLILVKDTEKAMDAIGVYYRKQTDKPMIAVTGSVGKTTTREMIAHVLSSSKKVYETKGNYNSTIGVPITLARMELDSDCFVLECGTNHFHEIAQITDMVNPNIGVVTMIGVSHLENFLTRENILKEKMDIAKNMKESDVLFLNGDDTYLSHLEENEIRPASQIIYFGHGENAKAKASDSKYEDGFMTFMYENEGVVKKVRLSVLGEHNVLNATVSLAIAQYLGIDMDAAVKSLESFSGLRQRLIASEKALILDDCYNASPDSMKASLNVLMDIPCKGRKIAVLGDMYELGQEEQEFHEEVGRYAAQLELQELITIGNLGEHIGVGARNAGADFIITSFLTKEEALEYLLKKLKKEDLVLVKASNGLHLNQLVDMLK